MGEWFIRRRHQEGQSTFEYVLVLAAVIAVIIWASVTFIAGSTKDSKVGGVKSIMHDSKEVMVQSASKLKKDLGLAQPGNGN